MFDTTDFRSINPILSNIPAGIGDTNPIPTQDVWEANYFLWPGGYRKYQYFDLRIDFRA